MRFTGADGELFEIGSRRLRLNDCMKLMKYSSLISIALLIAACGSTDREETPRDSLQPSSTSVPSLTPDPGGSSSRDWKVSPHGAGSVRMGMTLSELSPQFGAGVDTAAIADGCDYVSLNGAPQDLAFMVEERRLVRIEVDGPTATLEGARVGDNEERILQIYPNARRAPHKYTDGFYLIVIPRAPTDTVHRYVFETDGHRVTMYRAGVYPPVEYVEDCS